MCLEGAARASCTHSWVVHAFSRGGQIDLLLLCMLLAQDQWHHLILLQYMNWAETHGSNASPLSAACSHM